MKTTRILALALATVPAAVPGYLLAQDAGQSDNQNAATLTQLQPVIVTAELRPEDQFKVPVSVFALSNKTLEDRSVTDLADVAAITPSVDYQGIGALNRISIRGISNNNTTSSEYSTVGIYINDTPIMVRPSGFVNQYGTVVPDVFDLDRVEVLEGPQGTLFGAGAEGGVIRFVTQEPSLTTSSGYSRVSVGETDGGGPSYEAGVAEGGPIVANDLGFRVSAWYRRDGGYIQYDSPLGGYQANNGNWSNSTAVQAALTWAPTDSLHITPSVFYQDVYLNNMASFEPATSLASDDYFTQLWGGLHPQYSNPSNGYFVNPDTIQTPNDDNFVLPAVKAVWDLGPVMLTSNTSYMDRRNDLVDDFTPFAQNFFGIRGWTTDAGAVAGDHNIISLHQNVLTQEVRLQSETPNKALEWTVGLWYSNARQVVFNPEENAFMPQIIQQMTGMTLQQYTGVPLMQPGNIEWSGWEPGEDEQTALFGQGTYHFAKRWSLVAGARASRETNHYFAYQIGAEDFTPAPIAFGGEISQTVVDPKFGINYQPNDNNLFYVSATKGDRIGGVNGVAALGPSCVEALDALGTSSGKTFKADSLWSYEIGSKNVLADDRVTIAASAFYVDWSNVQFGFNVPACASQIITNLGAATSEGGQLQVNALIAPGLQASLATGYTKATVSKTIALPSGKLAATNGDQINPYAVPWTVSGTLQYTRELAADYQGYVHLDDVYHSKNPGPFAQDAVDSVSYTKGFIPNPSYNVLDLHVGMTTGGLDLSVYALNLLNTHPVLYNAAFESDVQPDGGAYTIRPLTFGMTAEYRW
jgi:iron complex outermembrane recepter protein